MSNFDANTGRLPLSWHLRSGEQLQSWSSEARWHFYWHTSVDWQPNRQRGIAGVPGARNQHIALQIERPAPEIEIIQWDCFAHCNPAASSCICSIFGRNFNKFRCRRGSKLF